MVVFIIFVKLFYQSILLCTSILGTFLRSIKIHWFLGLIQVSLMLTCMFSAFLKSIVVSIFILNIFISCGICHINSRYFLFISNPSGHLRLLCPSLALVTSLSVGSPGAPLSLPCLNWTYPLNPRPFLSCMFLSASLNPAFTCYSRDSVYSNHFIYSLPSVGSTIISFLYLNFKSSAYSW